jgi:hypothetical protein
MIRRIGSLIRKSREAVATNGLSAGVAVILRGTGVAIVALISVGFTLGAAINEHLMPGRYTLSADSAVFLHGGWYMTVGGVPYVDMFDVKPPVVFEISAILSILAGGDPMIQLWLSIATMTGAVVATVWLVCALVREVTDDRLAGVLAAIVVATYPFFFYYAAKGIRPKILVLPVGLAAILTALRGRGVTAGVLASVAAGTYQMGLFFTIVIFPIFIRRKELDRPWDRWRQLGYAVLGGVFTTLIIVTPIIIQGGLIPMVVETVVVPLSGGADGSIAFAALKTTFLLGFSSIPVLASVVGILGVVWRSGLTSMNWNLLDTGWFVPAGIVFYILILSFNVDYYPDLFPLVVFAALGVGVIAAKLNQDRQAVLAVGLCVIIALNAGLALGIGPLGGFSPLSATERTSDRLSIDTPDRQIDQRHGPYYDEPQGEFMNELYWERLVPEYCHYRFSIPEMEWLQRTGRTYHDKCGVPA